MQPLLDMDTSWSRWYELHPHHWPMRWSSQQRMLFPGEDFFKKILSLATGAPSKCITHSDTTSEVILADWLGEFKQDSDFYLNLSIVEKVQNCTSWNWGLQINL